ncbi:MAG: basic amino acid ABC transporter substrate-binding protein [Iphinoe sp. HA4291-MV1]|jgi:arginine/lysine/histidine/glutamine transport system substrate-binding/permease protein|nr:basic amino acid ABC transporter substrate-binding protein [Iphinoe sp. HA4291-MV1]
MKHFLTGLGAAVILSACENSGSNTGSTSNDKSKTTAKQTSQTGQGKTIKVATEPAFPPFESKGSGNELVGFDIDLIKAVGQAAGLTVEFQSLPFDGIIPGLQANTVDAAISSITITSERAQAVSFSRPYFKAGLAIAVRQENTAITNLDSLKGKNIAVQIGTTGSRKAKSISGAQVREFDSAPLALQELANGNVDAVINDAPVTLEAIKSGNIKGLKVVGQLITEEYYGIALPKNSPNLNAINTALAKIISNGSYAQIYKKWFSAEPPKLPETAPASTS